MKFLVYIFLFFSFSSFAQIAYSPVDTLKGEEVFTMVDEIPEFPGGAQKMMGFIQKNIVYPSKEKSEKIGGKVFLKFTIQASGNIKDIVLIKSSGNDNIDKEAIRVVSIMPKWKPGMAQGKPVPAYFNLPINFNPN